MEPTTTTITLDTFFVSEDDQKATGPGAADTASITLISTTDPTKTIAYPTTSAAEIAALVPGSVWTQQLVPAPAAAPTETPTETPAPSATEALTTT